MNSETSSTDVKQIAKTIGTVAVGFIVGYFMLMIIFWVVIVGSYNISAWMSGPESFRIGGFQLGSYDPARYMSEIVRRP